MNLPQTDLTPAVALRTADRSTLARVLAIDPKTLALWMRDPNWPPRINTPGRPRWLLADVLAYLRSRPKGGAA